MIIGGYNPDKHEYDPLLEVWVYGGPDQPTFWLPHNAEMAGSWCEHIGYDRQEGIRQMVEYRQKRRADTNDLWEGTLVCNGKTYGIESFVIQTSDLTHKGIAKLATAPGKDVLDVTGISELAKRGVQIINDGVNVLNGQPDLDPVLLKLLTEMGLK